MNKSRVRIQFKLKIKYKKPRGKSGIFIKFWQHFENNWPLKYNASMLSTSQLQGVQADSMLTQQN